MFPTYIFLLPSLCHWPSHQRPLYNAVFIIRPYTSFRAPLATGGVKGKQSQLTHQPQPLMTTQWYPGTLFILETRVYMRS